MKKVFWAIIIFCFVFAWYELKPTPGICKWEERLFKHRLFWRDYKAIEKRFEKLDRKLVGPSDRRRIAAPFDVAFVVKGNHARLRRWCNTDPDSYIAFALMGRCDLSSAWNCRGGAWGHKLSSQQVSGFKKWLKIGKDHLLHSYALNHDFAYSSAEMITYCMGMGLDRAEMEMWYERALRADPWNVYAQKNKMEYLQPKWCGSLAEMLDYASECLAPDAPPFFGARAIGTFWRFMHHRKEEILLHHDLLRRAAHACKQHYENETIERYYLRLGAYFAFRCGEYELANEMYPRIRWNKKKPLIHTLWANEAAFEKERELVAKIAAGEVKAPPQVSTNSMMPIVHTHMQIDSQAITLPEPSVLNPSPELKKRYTVRGIAKGKNGFMAIINDQPILPGDQLNNEAMVLDITEHHVDLYLKDEIYRFHPQ